MFRRQNVAKHPFVIREKIVFLPVRIKLRNICFVFVCIPGLVNLVFRFGAKTNNATSATSQNEEHFSTSALYY